MKHDFQNRLICAGLICLLLSQLGQWRARAEIDFDTTDPLTFFTNVANRLIEPDCGFCVDRIQVWPTNQLTPEVVRRLRVAANLFEATTNRYVATGEGGVQVPLPVVFRPVFTNINSGEQIAIAGWEEVQSVWPLNLTNPVLRLPRDLDSAADRESLQPDDNIYGVPFIFGARSGLPNFNEYSMQSVVSVTRRLQLRRPSTQSMPTETNQMYSLSLDAKAACEAWNSSQTNFPLGVEMWVNNDLQFGIALGTNEPLRTLSTNLTGNLAISAGEWVGFSNVPGTGSFQVPMSASITFLSNAVWRTTQPLTGLIENSGLGFERTGQLPLPDFNLSITNRLRFFVVETNSGRLIDYVALNGLGSVRDIGAELLSGPEAQVVSWYTNRLEGNSLGNPPLGVANQITISLGQPVPGFPSDGEWNNYGIGQPTGQRKYQAIDWFRMFFGLSPIYFPGVPSNTNLVLEAPFSPTRTTYLYQTWQANDPPVHHVEAELRDTQRTNVIEWVVPPGFDLPPPKNIGRMNDRYNPWGGNPNQSQSPNAYDPSLKDPGIIRSDHWNFPENVSLVSTDWLGQVHRGTPWQTLYLKSGIANAEYWQEWSGSAETHPTNDWQLVSRLISLLDANHPADLVSVNEPDATKWLALLDGLTALTNTIPDETLSSSLFPIHQFESVVTSSNSPQSALLAEAIAQNRSSQPHGRFAGRHEVLSVPELTLDQPWLNRSNIQKMKGITDEAYETVAAQLLPLLRDDLIGEITRTNGAVSIQFNGFDGIAHAIDCSTNFTDWQEVFSGTPENGVIEFTAPEPDDGQPRYYRARTID